MATRGVDVYMDKGKGRDKGKGGRHSEGTLWWDSTYWSGQRYTAFGTPPPYNPTHDREFAGDPMDLHDDNGAPPAHRRRR